MIELDAFQKEAVDEASKAYPGRRYKPLFQDVGLGKTVQYARIAEFVAGRTKGITWLITIKTAKQGQLEKIMMSDRRVASKNDILIIDGDELTRKLQFGMALYKPPLWIILNYDQLRLHADILVKMINPEKDVLILDEVDLIQNSTSDRSLVATAMACKAHYRIVATATAVKNKVDSIYASLKACDPAGIHHETMHLNGQEVNLPVPEESSFWGSQGDFLRRYAVFDDYGRIIGSRNIPELHRRLEDFGASIVAADEVMDFKVLPPAYRDVFLYPEAQGIYNQIKTGIIEWAEENEWDYRRGGAQEKAHLKLKLLSQINYARRLVGGLSPENFIRLIRMNKAKRENDGKLDDDLLSRLNLNKMEVGGNAKMDAAVKYVSQFDEPGGIAVYSEWTDVLDEFEQASKPQHQRLGFGKITGAVPDKERQRVIKGVESGDVRLVALSDAGGRSIDLPGLNKVLVLTPPWTHSQVEQTFGRVARRGQDKPMQITYLVTQSTIESKRMMPVLSQKGQDSDRIKYGQRGKRSNPLMGIESLYEVVGWL